MTELYGIGADKKVKLNLHHGQSKAWNSKKRFVFVLSGSQAGKTSFGVWWIWREIQEKGSGDYLVVTPTFPLLDKKLLPEFIKVFHTTLKMGKWWSANKVYEVFDPETGKGAQRFHDPMYARIMFCSAKNADSLESATAKAAWLDECGQDDFTIAAWEAVQRRLTLNQGRVFGSTTIYNWAWLKQQVYDKWKSGESTDIDIIQFRSIANPMFPREEYFRAMKTMPLWKFRMFYDGEYDRPAGMIYDSFDFDKCKVPTFAIPNDWPIFVGVDFGGVHMAALFTTQDPETKRFYHYKEYLKGGLSIADHANNFKDIVGLRPMRWIGGAAPEDQWRREFQEAGIPLMEPPIKEVEVGIQRVYNFHKRNQIFVFETLTRYLDQKGSYSRKLDDNNQPTEEIKDKNEYHLLDCERVLFSDLWERQGYLSEDTLKAISQTTRNKWTPPTTVINEASTNRVSRWGRGRKF